MAAISSSSELHSQLSSRNVLFFWASWHEPCQPGGQMDQILDQLGKTYTNIAFLRIEAEAVPDLSSKYNIQAVPTFIALNGTTEIGRVEGVDAPGINRLVESLSKVEAQAMTKPDEDAPLEPSVVARLKSLVNSAPVILFMKGTTEEPKCKFSRKVLEILKGQGISFATFNILQDEEVRQTLKKYSDWPTYPQLYVNGDLVGGVDIIEQLANDGALQETCTVARRGPSLEERLGQLVRTAPVMLFMKGNPEEPRCGFSRKIVALLQEGNVAFGHFDILGDEEVRQGLKAFSNWPTYPQLYVKGELVGGLDILQELAAEEGGLAAAIGAADLPPTAAGAAPPPAAAPAPGGVGSLDERLAALVRRERVMLFMKGSPDAPQCGFSSRIVALLRGEGFRFGHFDILGDEEVRQGLKKYSDWPTYPQLYVDGDLVGGLDIVQELKESGELAAMK
uniref:Glutaredoxin n=1 Tax=Heterosigma akashiwo TaxID=2829 RepID=A0A6V1P2P2_HETAK